MILGHVCVLKSAVFDAAKSAESNLVITCTQRKKCALQYYTADKMADEESANMEGKGGAIECETMIQISSMIAVVEDADANHQT